MFDNHNHVAAFATAVGTLEDFKVPLNVHICPNSCLANTYGCRLSIPRWWFT